MDFGFFGLEGLVNALDGGFPELFGFCRLAVEFQRQYQILPGFDFFVLVVFDADVLQRPLLLDGQAVEAFQFPMQHRAAGFA